MRANGPGGAGVATAVVAAGDWAGANLAAAASLAAGSDRPDRLVLICAPLDTSPGPARSGNVAVDAAGLAMMMSLYVQDGTDLADARISPLHADDAALATLPPTLLQVSGAEFLLADSQRFAAGLAGVGVRTVLSIWPAMPHVWHAFVDVLPEASAALDEIAQFVRGAG